MPPGRPRKYATEELRLEARRSQRNGWYNKNSRLVNRRKRDARKIGREGSPVPPLPTPSPTEEPKSPRGQRSYDDTRLSEFIDANPSNPAACLSDHVLYALTYSPSPADFPLVREYWERALDGIQGRAWAEFIFDYLVSSDASISRFAPRHFTETLRTLGHISGVVDLMIEQARKADVYGRKTLIRRLTEMRQSVKDAELVLDELMACRGGGFRKLKDCILSDNVLDIIVE
ncbi:hypothetical protein SCHPADRAFT_896739 [Schizopora paradoxa]|uniref:Uncharacterized protein n=1 Tax=Schizopora paradoxa TaxID=27342 RepID=A0A0H2QZI9_9AGAM|nr:hypothetical protein SCHPADRAFT_896739 [Schizopora paradoxa]